MNTKDWNYSNEDPALQEYDSYVEEIEKLGGKVTGDETLEDLEIYLEDLETILPNA